MEEEYYISVNHSELDNYERYHALIDDAIIHGAGDFTLASEEEGDAYDNDEITQLKRYESA